MTAKYFALLKNLLDNVPQRNTSGVNKEKSGMRLAAGHGADRGSAVEITFDGLPLTVFSGETVAAALMGEGFIALRRTAQHNAPRGMFCGIGVCFDCMLIIDKVSGCRACMTLVRAGMVVETQLEWLGDRSIPRQF